MRYRNLRCLVLCMAFGLSISCATKVEHVKLNKKRPAMASLESSRRDLQPPPSPTEVTNLFDERRYGGFYEDLRAFRVGDLVTVNIVETSKAKKKAETKTERSSSLSAGINNLLGYETKMRAWGGFPSAFSNTAMFKGSMTNEFQGTGETTRDESMTASITARVVEVLPNGNLVIRGTRYIRVNNENQYIILSGIIRPVDISPDNTILSSYIADARIEYSGKGSVSDKQRPGWLTRLLDYVWPF